MLIKFGSSQLISTSSAKSSESQYSGRSVKHSGIALPDPTQTAGANCRASFFIIGYLVASLRGTAEFRTRDYAFLIGERGYEICRRHAEDVDTSLGESQASVPAADSQWMGRITYMGVWLSVLPSTINMEELWAQEWRNFLFLRYGIDPPVLLEYCNQRGTAFDIYHALDCKKGGLITERHKKISDWVNYLASKAFTPTHVSGNPQIYRAWRELQAQRVPFKG